MSAVCLKSWPELLLKYLDVFLVPLKNGELLVWLDIIARLRKIQYFTIMNQFWMSKIYQLSNILANKYLSLGEGDIFPFRNEAFS